MPIPARQFSRKILAAVSLALLAIPAFADSEPGDWLNRMASAVKTSNYEGTVIRIRDGQAEALKVIHTIKDGVIREKVVAQEGNGLEIIRNGNEVHCILPDRKSVLIEEWDDQSTLFSTLPKSEIRFGSEYDLSLIREDRVAGRKTLVLAIRPHDSFRYGHRIWLDSETGFPLQTKLIDEAGATIEQVKFADISLNHEIHASALAPSYSTEKYTWLRQSSGHVFKNVDIDWVCDEPPAGFKVVSAHEDEMPGSDDTVTHIMYSDGLADVSVFIAPAGAGAGEGASTIGGSNSFNIVNGDFEITAIGEVPAATVRKIATTMRRP